MIKSLSALQIMFADLNRDNLPDLIFHFWSGQNSENAGAVVSGSPNRLVVLLSNGDGTYSDGTFTLTKSDNPIQLDGVSRKSLHHAILNADGYQDIFFAINREDGRSGNHLRQITHFRLQFFLLGMDNMKSRILALRIGTIR